MSPSNYLDLGRRERQIMDVVYRLGRASVADVIAGLDDPPSYSTVRAMMGKLERKGHLTHEEESGRYVYLSTEAPEEATETALRRMLGTFFDGSPSKAVAALLDVSEANLTNKELDELAKLIADARRRGR